MCDYSGKLVAWLDREMQADEASEMERHVAACAECRNCAEELDGVSGAFEDYCEGQVQSWELIQGYGARLSAPGYLDCTPWSVFETEEEAERYLEEMYGDDEEEEGQ